ncbi:MAG: type II toxin-antitoxin system VapC family toxin [Spirochaetales bacterium]|nr:type II toxin-antitoxin system VapC family toxin [Spirochaetales bacterium]
MASSPSPVLLDTHIALWILLDAPELPLFIRRAMTAADRDWVFHQISLWEIQIKYDLGKLGLPAPPQRLLPEAMRRTGFVQAPLEDEAIFLLGKLPAIHRDPFDRLLIAHAVKNSWVIATVDRVFERYPVRLLE